MQKVLTIAAIASLSLASDAMEDNSLNFFKTLGNDIKKAGQFVVQHPQIITTAAKILALDDEMTENELSFWSTIANDAQKAGNFVIQHPELINTAVHILHKDDEISENELNFFKYVNKNLEKAAGFAASHPEIITQGVKLLAHDDDIDEELFNVRDTVHQAGDGIKKVAKYVYDHRGETQGKPMKPFPRHPELTNRRPIHHDDEELFNAHNAVHTAANGVKKAGHAVENGAKKAGHYVYDHRQQIANGAKNTYHFAQQHPELVKAAVKVGAALLKDDEELFSVQNTVHTVGDGIRKVDKYLNDHRDQILRKPIQTSSRHPNLPNRHPTHHDDEELFNAHNAVHTAANGIKKAGHAVENGAKKAGHYVYDHRQQIANGAKNTYHFAQQHPELVKAAVKVGAALLKDDEELELFNVHNAAHTAANGVKKAGHAVENGAKKAGHYVYDHRQQIANGAKNTYHFAQQHPELVKAAVKVGAALLKDDEEFELFNLGGLIHDGVNIYKDIKTHNYGGLVNDGIQTFKDIKQKKHDDEDDEELFNTHNAVHSVANGVKKAGHAVENGAKKAGHYVYDHRQQIANGAKNTYHFAQQHPELVKTAVKVGAALLKDDEELFNLGGLINDGLHIYKDVKTHNYGGLVNDGIQTVKDVKQATHGKHFLGH